MRAPTSRRRAWQRCEGGGTAPPRRAGGHRLGHAVQAARTGVCATPPARRRPHAPPHAAHLVCGAGPARAVRGSPRRCSRRRSWAPCNARCPPRGAPRGGTARCIGSTPRSTASPTAPRPDDVRLLRHEPLHLGVAQHLLHSRTAPRVLRLPRAHKRLIRHDVPHRDAGVLLRRPLLVAIAALVGWVGYGMLGEGASSTAGARWLPVQK